MRYGHVWFGMAGGVRHCGVWLGAVRRGKAGMARLGTVVRVVLWLAGFWRGWLGSFRHGLFGCDMERYVW